ncbi:MAG: TrkH family potassium uptake protein [Bacillota bacterium]
MHRKLSDKPADFLAKRSIRPERILALGFLCLIVTGSILLSLPISSITKQSIGLHNAFFTATSSVCVTGLVVLDTGNSFSLFGRMVILLLIQIGGLGLMIFATLVMIALGRRISLRNRVLIRESMNTTGLSGLIRLIQWFTLMAVSIELIGAVVLSTRFIPIYGLSKGIENSVFHAVSAFCNAGFDLLGDYKSMTDFSGDPVIVLTVASLIILGGLGFFVLLEIYQNRMQFHKFSLHTKLVLIITASLLVLGLVLTVSFEWSNEQTLGGMNFFEKLLNSFFQSVTLRTAGFSTINQAALTDSSKLIGIIFMFIGASPASTGGGVKTTTIGVLALLVFSVVQASDSVVVFRKQIPFNVIRRALAIVLISLFIVILCACALSLTERDSGMKMIDLLFESTSAFGTVGLSSVNTQDLSRVSQMFLIPVMFFGRVGPLTLAFALARRLEHNAKNRLHYPEDKPMIG